MLKNWFYPSHNHITSTRYIIFMKRLLLLLQSARQESAVLLGAVKESVRDHVKLILTRVTVLSSLENKFRSVTTNRGHGDHLTHSGRSELPFPVSPGSKLYGSKDPSKAFWWDAMCGRLVQEGAVYLTLERKYLTLERKCCFCLWRRIQRKYLFFSD